MPHARGWSNNTCFEQYDSRDQEEYSGYAGNSIAHLNPPHPENFVAFHRARSSQSVQKETPSQYLVPCSQNSINSRALQNECF